MPNIALAPSARIELAGALAECGPLGEDPEPFLASVFARMGSLPADLIRALYAPVYANKRSYSRQTR